MNIGTNEYRNYISYKNEIIQCDNLERMGFIENYYGEKLIKKEDIKYSDILNMQYTIKIIERYSF